MTQHTIPVAVVVEADTEDAARRLLYDSLIEADGVLVFARIEGITPEVKVEFHT